MKIIAEILGKGFRDLVPPSNMLCIECSTKYCTKGYEYALISCKCSIDDLRQYREAHLLSSLLSLTLSDLAPLARANRSPMSSALNAIA